MYDVLQEERFYTAFTKSQLYIKLLAELDLLKDGSKSDDGDGGGLTDDGTSSLKVLLHFSR